MKRDFAISNSSNILADALDLHVHSAPDIKVRKLDDVALARACLDAGASGALIKSHVEPTAGRAFLARLCAPGSEMYGGIVLNRAVGGLNPAALDAFAATAGGLGRIVWLPTRDAEHEIAVKKRTNPTVEVTRDGAPAAGFHAVAEVIAAADLVLATGHVAPDEALILLKEARALGCRRLLVTHATAPISDYTIDQLDAAADMGAVIELSARNVYSKTEDGMQIDADRVARAAEVMRRYGAGRVILSSDLGDTAYPSPPVGLGEAAKALLAAGIGEEDVRSALVTAPRDLIDRQAAQFTA